MWCILETERRASWGKLWGWKWRRIGTMSWTLEHLTERRTKYFRIKLCHGGFFFLRSLWVKHQLTFTSWLDSKCLFRNTNEMEINLENKTTDDIFAGCIKQYRNWATVAIQAHVVASPLYTTTHDVANGLSLWMPHSRQCRCYVSWLCSLNIWDSAPPNANSCFELCIRKFFWGPNKDIWSTEITKGLGSCDNPRLCWRPGP